MQYLSDYTKDAQTKAFDELGAFFAFGTDQFNEKKVDGVTYASMGHGLICPKENCKELFERLENAHQEGIKLDIQENGLEAIIKRELSNYESYYTGCYQDALDSLKDYEGVTEEMVQNLFYAGLKAS